MATGEIRFRALPAPVRTARLVAAAAARRAGVDEQLLDEIRLAVGEACSRGVGGHRGGGGEAGGPGVDEQLLDEIRLAVGEACSRAVGLHRRGGLNVPVTVTMGGEGERFVVAVRDNLGDPSGLAAPEADGWDDVMLGLSVVPGLVEDPGGAQLSGV